MGWKEESKYRSSKRLVYIPISLVDALPFPLSEARQQMMSMERTTIIRIPAPIPTTRIKLECFPLLGEAIGAGFVGKCRGASFGGKGEAGAASANKNLSREVKIKHQENVQTESSFHLWYHQCLL